ncbi:MAG: glutamyl-tRNA amidotransferase [Lachnospiraceae bacterium]|nr:glutamyl-tRNA amidotransferase [Lachnospiraceae bacterium]MCI9184928.1 glutamyl-tRNA amidotransferase [Lachnospiraceae bacterium]
MILVDIYVPGANQTYDFNLDENAKIELLLEEIAGMICQKEQSTLEGSVKELLLVSQNRKMILNSGLTLSHYNIIPGDRLMLV